jgi:hypothetical protein
VVVIGCPGGEKARHRRYFGKRGPRRALGESAALGPHRDAALEDAARDRALPDRLPPPGIRDERAPRLQKSLRQLVGRLKDVTDRQTRQIRRNLDRHSVALVLDSRVEDADGRGDGLRGPSAPVGADVFLIATGSSPTPPAGSRRAIRTSSTATAS